MCFIRLTLQAVSEGTWNRWNRHLTSQFAACSEVVTLVFATLPRLSSFVLSTHWWHWPLWIQSPQNIYFFFPLPVATNSGAIHHAARAGAGDCVLRHISMLAWSPYGKKLNKLGTDGCLALKSPTVFPQRGILGSAPASLWRAYLLLGGALGSSACVQQAVKDSVPRASSPTLVRAPPPPWCIASPPQQRSTPSRKACRRLATILFLHTNQNSCPWAKDLLQVVGGDVAMFLNPEIKRKLSAV